MMATTYCAEADLVGKAACRFYREMGCDIAVTGTEPVSGVISYGNSSCTVRRLSPRNWEVGSGYRVYSLGSQWELLAWIGDRL